MRIAALVLAAGASRRMGSPKALLPYRGGVFLGAILDKLRFAGISEIVVVAAPDDRMAPEHARRARARVAINSDPGRGMLSSVTTGLDVLAGRPPDALLLWPVDHPAVDPSTVRALTITFERSPAPVIVPVHEARRGHPTLFARATFAELRTASLELGARQVVEAHHADLIELEVDDPGILADIDTPEDLARLAQGGGGEPDDPAGR